MPQMYHLLTHQVIAYSKIIETKKSDEKLSLSKESSNNSDLNLVQIFSWLYLKVFWTACSIISDDTPMVCQHLKHVTKTVWNRGLVETLEQLFVVSEDLVAGPELHSQLLQAQ